jgi:hypothetical protein
MRRKLLTLVAALGITALASWTPGAEAAAIANYCTDLYCQGKGTGTVCACPPWTERFGYNANCGNYHYACFWLK